MEDRFWWVKGAEIGSQEDWDDDIVLEDREDWDDAIVLEDEPTGMPSTPSAPQVPAVALVLSREMAAEVMSMSVDHFERHVLPHIRVMQTGRKVGIPVRELEAFVGRESARALKS